MRIKQVSAWGGEPVDSGQRGLGCGADVGEEADAEPAGEGAGEHWVAGDFDAAASLGGGDGGVAGPDLDHGAEVAADLHVDFMPGVADAEVAVAVFFEHDPPA